MICSNPKKDNSDVYMKKRCFKSNTTYRIESRMQPLQAPITENFQETLRVLTGEGKS